jgi:TrpR-related protein YerC/YecD
MRAGARDGGPDPVSAIPSREVESLAGLDDLAGALLSLRDEDEVVRFLRDLCTLSELEALAHRWQIARLLEEGRPYLEIAETIGTSTATVTRVAQWLRHGTGGYRIALERAARTRPRTAKA